MFVLFLLRISKKIRENCFGAFDIQVKNPPVVQVLQCPQRLVQVVQGQVFRQGAHLSDKLS